MTPAIVLSSHTIGLAIIRGLGSMGIPVIVFYYEKRDMGYVSKYVKERIYTPHPEHNEKEFINVLLNHAERFQGSVLIPADDSTLITISKHKEILSQYFIVTCPGWEMVRKYIDKKYSYEIAESIGIPVPKSLDLCSEEDLEQAGNTIEFPLLLKPRESHTYFDLFRKKLVLAYNKDDLLLAYREASFHGMKMLIQEYIPGDDGRGVNYNSYFWDGKPLCEFTAQKTRLAQPGSGVPRVVESQDIPEIIEPGRKIIQALGYNGYSCTEFKKDARDGIYKFLEVNGRHNRSGLLAIHCGINFPYIEYEHVTKGILPQQSSYKSHIYWIDEVSDLANSLKYYTKEKYTLLEYIKPYFNSHIFAVSDFRDIKPIAKRIIDVAKLAFQKIKASLKLQLVSKSK